MRLVVDTNVLISGIFWGGTPAEIIHAWADGKLKVVCSAEIIDEYSRIARRLNPGLETSQIDRFLSFLIGRSEIVQPNHWFKIILEDPGDDKFIDCAFHAQARMILSGDKHLLKLGNFGPIRISSPVEFKARYLRTFKIKKSNSYLPHSSARRIMLSHRAGRRRRRLSYREENG